MYRSNDNAKMFYKQNICLLYDLLLHEKQYRKGLVLEISGYWTILFHGKFVTTSLSVESSWNWQWKRIKSVPLLLILALSHENIENTCSCISNLFRLKLDWLKNQIVNHHKLN